jgi:hypothetical protein
VSEDFVIVCTRIASAAVVVAGLLRDRHLPPSPLGFYIVSLVAGVAEWGDDYGGGFFSEYLQAMSVENVKSA